MGSLGFHRAEPSVTIYRGQKIWHPGMELTATSIRKSYGVANPAQWTDGLIQIVSGLVLGVLSGAPGTAKTLEWQLLFSQQAGFQNPFVSCSYSRAVALSFALEDDTPGYLLTIAGDWHAGFDFEHIRQRFGLFGDAMTHLKEFGLPRLLTNDFRLIEVEKLDRQALRGTRIFP